MNYIKIELIFQLTNVDFQPIYVYLLWAISDQRLRHVHAGTVNAYDKACTDRCSLALGDLESAAAAEDTRILEHVFLFLEYFCPHFNHEFVFSLFFKMINFYL